MKKNRLEATAIDDRCLNARKYSIVFFVHYDRKIKKMINVIERYKAARPFKIGFYVKQTPIKVERTKTIYPALFDSTET